MVVVYDKRSSALRIANLVEGRRTLVDRGPRQRARKEGSRKHEKDRKAEATETIDNLLKFY